MSGSRQQHSAKGKSVNENQTTVIAATQVKIQEDGTVHVIYLSYDAYVRDQELLKVAKMSHDQVARASSTDRITSLPNEIQSNIIKYLIPNRGRIAVGYDYYGPNTSGIRSGSLNIARVSKHLLEIALQVLYGDRWFRISASCGYRQYDFVHTPANNLSTRWSVLRDNVDRAHSIHSPLECFRLLVNNTPAREYLTRLEVMINKSMGEVLIDGKLLKALQHAKGLRLLELFMGGGTPDIMPFVNELGHIRTIRVLSWLGQDVLYETQVTKRNQDWEKLHRR